MQETKEAALTRLRLQLAELEREWAAHRYLSPENSAKSRPLRIVAVVLLLSSLVFSITYKMVPNYFLMILSMGSLGAFTVCSLMIWRLMSSKLNGEHYVKERQALVDQIEELERK